MKKIFALLLLIILISPLKAFAVFKINTSYTKEYKTGENFIIVVPEVDGSSIREAFDYDLSYYSRFRPLNLLSSKELYAYNDKPKLQQNNRPSTYNISLKTGSKQNPQQKLNQIKLLEAKGDIQGVIKAYQTLLSYEPERVEFLYKYALALERAKRYNDTIIVLKRILNYNPDFVLGYFVMGNTYYKMGRFQDALSQYSNTIKKNPYCVDAFFNIACILEKMNEKQLAIEYYKDVLLLKPNDKEAKNSLFRLESQISYK